MAHGASLCLAALAFCTWCVLLGGIAAIDRYSCSSLNDVALQVKCSRTNSWWWWITFLELSVVLPALILSLVDDAIATYKFALGNLFSIATVLLMSASNSALTLVWTSEAAASALSSFSPLADDAEKLRMAVQTFLAGAIMCAIVNCFWILAVVKTDPPKANGDVEGGNNKK